MNIPGFVSVAAVAGVSGVTGGDFAMGVFPATWLSQRSCLNSCLVAAGIAIVCTKPKRSLDCFSLVWTHALGLSLFFAIGIHIALQAGFPVIVVPIVGVVSALFGGLVGDVLVGDRPLLFKKRDLRSGCPGGCCCSCWLLSCLRLPYCQFADWLPHLFRGSGSDVEIRLVATSLLVVTET